MSNFDIKQFLQSSYNKENFIHFIHDKFYGFEENDIGYEQELLNDTEKKHIQKYKLLGSCNLDDDKELGFFEVITTNDTDIENNRVSLNNILKKKASDELLDGAIAVFHNPTTPNVWRLSFIRFSYDDNNKQQVSNLKRYTYVLGEQIPTKTAYQQLKNLKYPKLNELQEAFSVEKISKEFFTKYKELYHKLVQDITVANGKENKTQEEQELHDKSFEFMKNEKDISFYIKKLLGRIVFLYFVQKKGWLDNDKRFLSNLFHKHTLKYPDGNFYDEVLEDLFFNALNTKRDNDDIKLGSDTYTIPYLNGGLFEEDNYDKTDLTISNEDLKQVLELFDSYNFTVIEDTPHDSEIAIDPEMLGKVFEDLLEDRKEKGAFYTPREIVHYMCQQSIINYLINSFENEEAIKDLVLNQSTDNKYIKTNAKKIQEKLFDIKVLDPAIGSGAFPMGMLHEIVQVLLNIDKTADMGELKRKVIEHCIYGVDIEHSAVEIAKLRFWLSIVVDEEKPTPLPNLFYKIMVGNSLLETINSFNPLVQNQNTKGRKELILLRDRFHKFFNTSNNNEKKQIKEEIKRNVLTILSSSLNNFDIQQSLMMDKKEQKIYDENKANYDLLSEIIEEYKDKGFSTKLFFYKIYFKEVLDDGGFDVVIGNPPYVRQEKIKELKSKKEIQEFDSYCGTADLYIYFFEKGYKLLKPNGVLSFITSNKYTRAKYGKDFRKFVLENTAIKDYIDFNGVKVFESATVDTSILTYQKTKIKDNSFIYCDVDEKYKKGTELNKFIDEKGFDYYQSDLSENSFSFSSPQELKIKKQIEKIGTPLKEWDIKINVGLKTGFNEAFIIDNQTKDKLIKDDEKSIDIIKPLLRGRDIKKYSFRFADKWLINLHNNPPVDINKYPAIKEHLDQYYDQLEKRSDKGITPYNLRNCAYLNEFEKEKIMYSEIVQSPQFHYDKDNFYGEMTSFILSGKNLKYLISLLNSKPTTFFFKKFYMGTELGSKGFRYKKSFLNLLPIPQILENKQKPFEILIDYIIYLKELKKENHIIEFFERVIDVAVYELYFKEELHSKDFGILEVLESELMPFDNSFETIEKVYKKLSDKNHKVAYNVNFIDTLDIVKTIEGKN